MDAIALLCTLHADGPATLRRLRRAGCATLDSLEAYRPEELAAILEVPPAVARRLGREARILAERLDLRGFGDREEASEIAGPAAGLVGPSEGTLDRLDRAVLGRVLDRWRDETPAGASASAVPEAPQEAPPGRPAIPPQAVDGLDAGLAARLSEQGVGTLSDLVAAEPLDLANALGIAYSRVRRLQFLAYRAERERRVAEPAEDHRVEPEAPETLEATEALEATETLEATEATAPPPVAEAAGEAVAGQGSELPVAVAEPPQQEQEPPSRLEPAGELQPANEPEPAQDSEPAVGPEPRSELEQAGESQRSEVEAPSGADPAEPILRVLELEPAPPRRKFWEPRTVSAEAETEVPAPPRRREGVTLNWNFELHPPGPPADPVPQPVEHAVAADARLAEDDGAAGPFA